MDKKQWIPGEYRAVENKKCLQADVEIGEDGEITGFPDTVRPQSGQNWPDSGISSRTKKRRLKTGWAERSFERRGRYGQSNVNQK